MASVTIDSGPVTATQQLRNVPKHKWHDLMLARWQFLEINLNHDCRCLVEFVNDAAEMYAELGFANAEEMIRKGYKLQPEEIDIAVQWLQLNPSDHPISLTQAVTLGQRGRPKKGEEKGVHHTLKRGTGKRDYTLARLERDGHTALAALVRDGTMSANAAAVKVGIRKPPSPYQQVLKLLPKLNEAERAKIHESTKP